MTVNQARLHALLCAIGASLVLGACSDPSEAPGNAAPHDGALRFLDAPPASSTPAARVGDSVITIEDVRREARVRELSEDPDELQPGDPVFREALDALIDQRLLALEAARRGLQQSPEARRRLAAAEERILGNVLVETAVADGVTDEAVRRVYEEQARLAPPEQEVRARHILLESREAAREVLRELEDGADFAALARQVSQDPATRLEGGDLGYFTRSGILPEFARIAFATSPGEVSEPFETEAGWHVLKVVDRRAQPRPGLEAMRPSIVRFLTLQRIDALLETIRETYPVTITAGRAPGGLRRPEPGPVIDPQADEAEEAQEDPADPGQP
ncbi:peptidylprolyl isomerase [Alkalicaulis satelles]|uniref:peptidylprolyl isomerase n=1 Tax=Alkalicaulis satelles TaxID=2609175 RepID=UPI001E3E7C49|nr:peptidylprolyl isomerase [Alkalicaulis satelles]